MDATPGITGSLAAISRRVSQPLRNDRGMGVIGMRHVGRKCRFIANIMPKPGHSTARSDRAAWGPAAAPTGPSDTYLRPLARVQWRRDGPCCVACCVFFLSMRTGKQSYSFSSTSSVVIATRICMLCDRHRFFSSFARNWCSLASVSCSPWLQLESNRPPRRCVLVPDHRHAVPSRSTRSRHA